MIHENMLAPKPVSRRAKTRPDVSNQVPVDRVLDEAFWLTFGTNPKPKTRQKMLYVAIDDIRRVGPASFNALTLCDVLDVSYSLLNFHFGSRDELVAEALVIVYGTLVNDIRAAVVAAKNEPEARLRAFIHGTTKAFIDVGGWGVLITYPLASREVTELIRVRYGQEMVDLAELNLARLLQLVSDVQNGTVRDVTFEAGSLPADFFVADLELVALTLSVALAISGLAVWLGGRDPAEAARVGSAMDAIVEKLHVDRIIASI
jgi:AcrR family transcriptional regulator